MASEILSDSSEAGIFRRVIEPDQPTLPPDAAEALLKLDFPRADRQRMNALSRKASRGNLTSAEDGELENYIRVNHLLTIIQSKARLSLGKAANRTI